MNVLIIEDEQLAEDYLVKLLDKADAEIKVVGKANSVKSGIKWFLKNDHPDLVFTDIDLGDGLCFEIFEVIDVSCPIIFTTAFDQYAIKAFQVHSIDYLLKPVDIDELARALQKFAQLSDRKLVNTSGIQNAGKMLSAGYKERFIIKIGDRLKSIPVTEISYFMSQDKSTYACTKEGRQYLVDYSMDRVTEILNPAEFTRINRKYIISFKAILDIIAYSNSRLKIKLEGSKDDEIVVARDRVGDFKAWLDR
ncbi:MAG: LytTR family DNA-binding domain-containing protein [Bacteroidota bacterium]